MKFRFKIRIRDSGLRRSRRAFKTSISFRDIQMNRDIFQGRLWKEEAMNESSRRPSSRLTSVVA